MDGFDGSRDAKGDIVQKFEAHCFFDRRENKHVWGLTGPTGAEACAATNKADFVEVRTGVYAHQLILLSQHQAACAAARLNGEPVPSPPPRWLKNRKDKLRKLKRIKAGMATESMKEQLAVEITKFGLENAINYYTKVIEPENW